MVWKSFFYNFLRTFYLRQEITSVQNFVVVVDMEDEHSFIGRAC